ncbi:MAG: hypothetical protein ACRC3G_02970, partial [Bacteroidales bacterium]
MRKTFLTLLFFSYTLYLFATDINPEWGVNFFTFVDNREYKKVQYQTPQSLLGTWLAPEMGLRVDSTHQIRAGVSMQKHFGSNENFIDQLRYTAYYRYNAAPFELYVGSFPLRTLMADYPAAMMYDSILYLRPNMGGIFWKIHQSNWHTDIWLDWTGRQTDVNRESFLVGIAGKYSWKNNIYLSGQSYLNHFAKKASPSEDEEHGIVDNGMGRLCVGFTLSESKLLDSLNINIGGVGDYSRYRLE